MSSKSVTINIIINTVIRKQHVSICRSPSHEKKKRENSAVRVCPFLTTTLRVLFFAENMAVGV